MTKFLSILRRIAGMPDYAGYLAHHQEKHPGEPVLNERQFYDQYVEWRYGSGSTRCC